MQTHILEIRHLCKAFGQVQAVDDASLDVRSGEFLTLLGPSGCGKTTMLRLIAGFETPDSGRITLNGRVIAGDGRDVPPEERHIGMVFQEYALFPHLSVADNIAFGVRGDRRAKARRVEELLELVSLPGLGGRLPYELSGGQQQRVALARALAPAPDLILLDEPFSNLDAALRAQVRGEVRAILQRAGGTCIFVTHDQEEALSLSDRVAVIFDGRPAQVGTPQAIYDDPATLEVAAFVGESNVLTAQAEGDHAVCALGRVPLRHLAQGDVHLLLRPEMLALTPDALADSGTPARVRWQEYYGHSQRVGVQLADGTPLVVRGGLQVTYRPGDAVRVTVSAPVKAF